MGGKSTLLRQVCQATLLAQVGALVPAEELTLSAVDAMFVRMGARDNIMAGQSTFFGELNETSMMVCQGGGVGGWSMVQPLSFSLSLSLSLYIYIYIYYFVYLTTPPTHTNTPPIQTHHPFKHTTHTNTHTHTTHTAQSCNTSIIGRPR